MKTKIENGIEYRLENDIWYPNLKLKEDGINLGKYGLMRKNFLEEHYRYRFDVMLLTGELYSHCMQVEKQAKRIKRRLIKQYSDNGYSIDSSEILVDSFIANCIVLI